PSMLSMSSGCKTSVALAGVRLLGARGGRNAREYAAYRFTVVELEGAAPTALNVALALGLKALNVCSRSVPPSRRLSSARRSYRPPALNTHRCVGSTMYCAKRPVFPR